MRRPCGRTRSAPIVGPGTRAADGWKSQPARRSKRRPILRSTARTWPRSVQGSGQGSFQATSQAAGAARHRRYRSAVAQCRAPDRGRRQGARRLSQAARRRQDQERNRRRYRRHRSRPSARSPNTGSPTPPAPPRCRSRLGRSLSRSVGERRQAAQRRAGRAGDRARPARQALRRSGMVAEPVLRFPQAGLSAHHQLGRIPGQERRRHRRAYPPQGRVLRQARSPTRSRRRISSSPIRNCCARRSPPMPRTWCAAWPCWARTSRPARAISRSARPTPRSSRSGAISRSLPARWCSRTN